MRRIRRQRRSMIEGPLLPNIILYTIPIILTSLLQLLFNAADMIVVGNFCGSLSLAAVGATGAITNLILNVFFGLSVGTGVVTAQGIGANDQKAVYQMVHTALPVALISGGILTVVGITLSTPLLQLMDTPETVLPLSSLYMKIYFGGVTFSMVYNFSASILRAAGDTKSPLVFLTISGVLNVILNLVFVTVFHMNVAGVALATIISQAVSAVLVVLALMHRVDACRLHLRKLRIYKEQLLKIIRIGMPAGMQGAIFSVSNALIQSSVNSFGDIFMSGNAASANIEGFVYVALNAFSQTSVNFTGQNVGAKRYDRVKRVFLICLLCPIAVGVVFGGGAVLFGEQLLHIYITDSAEAIRYGMLRLSIICSTYFLCGMMDAVTGAIRGMGASVVTMLISIIGVCGFRISWIYTVFQIPEFHTPQSLFISYPISWIATLLLQILAFSIVLRKRMRQEAAQSPQIKTA